LGVLVRQHPRRLRPHAARGAGPLLLGARENRLAALDVGGPPARPREVGLSAPRRADAEGAEAAPRLRNAPPRARRDGRAPRPRGLAPAPRARGALARELPRRARRLVLGRRPAHRARRPPRRPRRPLGPEPPGLAHGLLRYPARGGRRRARRPRPRGPAAR